MADLAKRLQEFTAKVGSFTQSINVPELKQKKTARDAKLKAESEKAAADATKAAAEFEKEIYARAQQYEEEYNAVSIIITALLLIDGNQ